MFRKLVFALALMSITAYASTSYHKEKLEVAILHLLPSGWSVGFAKTEYRSLDVHYESERQIATMWADVLDEVGRRYGIAFLIMNEDKKIYVTPIDGFRTAGTHHIVTNSSQQRSRYQLDRWASEVITEKTFYDNLEIQNQALMKQAALAKIRIDFENQLEKEKVKFEKIIKQNNLSTNEKIHALNKQIELTEKTQASLNAKIEIYEQQTIKAQNSLVNSKIVEQEATTLKLNLKNEMEAYRLSVSTELERIHQEKEQQLANRSEIINKKESEVNAIVKTYYPQIDRTLNKGMAKLVINEFLSKYWKYNLSWSDELIERDQLKMLNLNYELNFSGDDLVDDISKIVCYMTRDIPGITIYSEIDPQSRVVVMQMHKGSYAVRQELIAQCFE